jgi:poly(3-hydroxybutyrate) depolymerase
MAGRESLLTITIAVLLILSGGSVALSHSAAAGTSSTALAATAGCGRTPTLQNGTNTIQSSGRNRSYILRIPAGYDNRRPYRLVFGFHWLNGTAADVATGQTVQRDVWSYYGLQRLA